jgi:hypothetical protein
MSNEALKKHLDTLAEVTDALESPAFLPNIPDVTTDHASEAEAILDLFNRLGCDLDSGEPMAARIRAFRTRAELSARNYITRTADLLWAAEQRLSLLAKHGTPGLICAEGLPHLFMDTSEGTIVAVDSFATKMPRDHVLLSRVPMAERWKQRFIALGPAMRVISEQSTTPQLAPRGYYFLDAAVELTARLRHEELQQAAAIRHQIQAKAEEDRRRYEEHPATKALRQEQRLAALEKQLAQQTH